MTNISDNLTRMVADNLWGEIAKHTMFDKLFEGTSPTYNMWCAYWKTRAK